MVAVPMSPAQAASLGLDVKVRKRMTRTTTRAPYLTTCAACAEVFDTRAAEDRHLEATNHSRYDIAIVLA